jgi:hypothetical protein
MKTNVLVLLLLAVSAAASHAETSIRCHSKVISVGDSKAEVLLKCGEPMLKESIGTIEESKRIGLPLTSTSGIAAENADPVVIRRKETVSKTVDQWTYHQGAGKLLKILIFEGAELVEITTGGRT